MSRFRTRPFTLQSMLITYGYSLTAILLTAFMLGVLGFALVSSLRHLLWVYMMNRHPMPGFWLWLEITALVVAIVVVWTRISAATLLQSQQRRRFSRRLKPHLKPLPVSLPPELSKLAEWFVVENQTDRYAFTWGIRRARVAVSQGLWDALDEASRQAVLYHEAGHVLARDPLQQMVLKVLAQALSPFGFELLYQRYLLRREILADTLAISGCEGDDVPLLKALLVVAESATAHEFKVGLAGALEARISFLESGQLPSWWDQHVRYRLLSMAIAVLLTIGEGLLVWCH